MLKSPFDVQETIVQDLWNDFLNSKIQKMKKFVSDYEFDLEQYKKTINDVFNKIEINNPNKFLIFGMIQSGKTDFMIGLICKIFSTYNSNLVFCFSQPNKNLMQQSYDRTKNQNIQNVYDFKHLKSHKSEIINKLKNKENVVVFLLKNKIHLDKANELISELKEIKYNSFIFDDEGDVTSFNNKNIEEGTTIFNSLKKLSTSSNSNYFSITATPYAHILVSQENFMNPNYIFSLKPSTGYTGINYFVNNWHSSQKPCFVLINKEENIDELALNDDFKNSIYCYIVQCFWWKYVAKLDNKPRMIINIDRLKINHDLISDEVKKVIDQINFKKISNYAKNEFNSDLSENDFLECKNIIKDIDVLVFNGDIQQSSSFDEPETIKYQIIIGNKKLDRGLTIVDLINSFILMRSNIHPNADSILQQARFLGYRDKYKEMIRVFLTKELIHDYIQINDNTIYFIDCIEESNNLFSNIDKFVPMDDENNLFPTRDSISDFEYESKNKIPLDLIINKYYKDNKDLDESNENFYKKFINFNGEFYYDKNQNKFIKFSSIAEFAKQFLNTTSISDVKSMFQNICVEKKNSKIFDQILSSEYRDFDVVVRFLDENKRKIEKRKSTNYYSIGKGIYNSNEKEFYIKAKTISIDIISILVYNDEEQIKEKIYRCRLFVPKEIIKQHQNGYRTI